jgi:hypothetical protein
METQIKINLALALALYKTNKDFFFFNLSDDNDQKVSEYTLSNDITRCRKLYSNFRVISCIKNSINTITI